MAIKIAKVWKEIKVQVYKTNVCMKSEGMYLHIILITVVVHTEFVAIYRYLVS